MEAFTKLTGIAVPIDEPNIDTNQLCPTRFNKVPRGAPNYRDILMHDRRFNTDGSEKEGLDRIFTAAGFEWRDPGCSLCTAINGDQLKPGERCASTSNRNFRGRQGTGGRTHLVSPAMAAAAALKGRLTDVRELIKR